MDILNLDLGAVKCEPNSPFFRCSQQSLDDCFLGREVLTDYNGHDDYSPEHSYGTDGGDFSGSPDSLDDSYETFKFNSEDTGFEDIVPSNKKLCLDKPMDFSSSSLMESDCLDMLPSSSSSPSKKPDVKSVDYTCTSSSSLMDSKVDYCSIDRDGVIELSKSVLDGISEYCTSTFMVDQDGVIDGGPKKVCLVCGDIASGFHYGVSSCEACKAFFKRTIQGNIGYSCPASCDCEITKRRRKACQACRFDKCLRVGMLREGVRRDRVRGGRQKYKRSLDSSQVIVVQHQSSSLSSPCSSLSPSSCSSSSLSPSATAIAAATSQLHHSYSATTQEAPSAHQPNCRVARHHSCSPSNHLGNNATSSSDNLVSKLLVIEAQLDNILALPDTSLADDEFKFMSVLSDVIDRELVITISWAKQVPGFINLTLNDQMNLLQFSWLDILCFNTVYRSCPYEKYLVYAEDFKILEDKTKVYNCPADFDLLARKLAKKITSLVITKEEFVLLKTLALCNPDANVENLDLIRDLHNTIMDALIDHVTRTCNTNVRRVGHLLLLLPIVTQLKILARNYWYEVKNNGRVSMHRLFLEMLEFEITS